MKQYRSIHRLLFAISVLLALLLPLPASASADQDSADRDSPRERFQAAEQALAQGDQEQFTRLAASLAAYPLHPYLVYAELSGRLEHASADEVAGFLNASKDTPLNWQLRRQWLDLLADRKRWETFLAFYRPTSDVDLRCHQLQALIATGQARQALPEVEALWLYGRSRPASCDTVFDYWIKAGNPAPALAWKRIALAMENGELLLARYLRRFLPADQQGWADYWLTLHRHPEQAAAAEVPGKSHPYLARMRVHATSRLAARDPLAALSLWQTLSGRHHFTKAQRHEIEQRLAAALLDEPSAAAYTYLRSLKPRSGDQKLQELRLRAALVREDWPTYLDWLGQLPPASRNQPRWQYWRARALAATGQQEAAQALYRTLAGERSYHGFLAADQAGLAYTLAHAGAPSDDTLLARLATRPALQRARELFALDRSPAARREWQWGIRGLNRNELIGAAKLAETWGWYGQAILTVAQGEHWDDLELRFPLAHRHDVEGQAERQALDPAWIYAVLRQESAFMPDARSHAGASGLMQLMPTTAKRVARRLPEPIRVTPAALHEPALNITLGSAYLREVLDRLYDNRVLATAAYNAGPHRVRKWLPARPMAADLWIESLPYQETRRYLRRVLTYTAIYQSRLGRRPEHLLEQMPVIQPAEDYVRNETALPASG